MRAALQEIDRDQPLVKVRTMEQAIGDSVAQPRLRTVLAHRLCERRGDAGHVGVYGVMAYTVLQRTHEIGVRVALGASQGDVVRMVVRQGAVLTAIGVAFGLAAAALADPRARGDAVRNEGSRSAHLCWSGRRAGGVSAPRHVTCPPGARRRCRRSSRSAGDPMSRGTMRLASS